jgi:formylglycine-generating enzyme required for sulfatase activity
LIIAILNKRLAKTPVATLHPFHFSRLPRSIISFNGIFLSGDIDFEETEGVHHMKTMTAIAILGACLVGAAWAEPLSIVGFETGGGMAFEGATVSNYYTLEFAPTLAGPWTNWGSVCGQSITGTVMALPSPFFYRIRQTDSSAFPPYAPASNIPGSMLADGAITAEKLAPDAVNLGGSAITGTIPDAHISSNVALLNASQTFSGQNTFAGKVGIGTATSAEKLEVAGAVKLGNTANSAPAAGTIRWTGMDFEGFTGSGWVSLTSMAAPAGMALIPAGTFVMGATTNMGHESNADAIPQHTVDISAFYIDKYEVTKALWDQVYEWSLTNGYTFYHPASGKATNHPVHSMSWYSAVKWCNARSEKEGLMPCYTTNGVIFRTGEIGYDETTNVVCNWSANGYRLPTEAEWEKAARGWVVDHRFPWGGSDEIQHARANYNSRTNETYDTSPTRGFHPAYTNEPRPYTSPVGSFASNGYGLGLYDMAGNVWEWCWDWYAEDYYVTSPGTNPSGPPFGFFRVIRGGSWADDAGDTRCACRQLYGPEMAVWYGGFRCARRP